MVSENVGIQWQGFGHHRDSILDAGHLPRSQTLAQFPVWNKAGSLRFDAGGLPGARKVRPGAGIRDAEGSYDLRPVNGIVRFSPCLRPGARRCGRSGGSVRVRRPRDRDRDRTQRRHTAGARMRHGRCGGTQPGRRIPDRD